MPKYRVTFGKSGNSVLVDANSPEDARRKVNQDIEAANAKRTAAPYLDDVLFDYDTGIKDFFLRTDLGRAETFEERERIAVNYFGEDGFIFNSKGELAATPVGLRRVGLRPSFVELDDGSILEQNRIVDEVGISGADFLDFSGIVGPIAGAVVALSPQGRFLPAVKSNLRIFGDRVVRPMAAGLGTAAGKGAEEALDAIQGFQNQQSEDIAKLLGTEFLIGAGGQVIGEVFGASAQYLIGKKAPFADNFLYGAAAQKYSLLDVLKLRRALGREPTLKEMDKAAKEGLAGVKIRINDNPGLPSQSAFNKAIPGRLQATSEVVFGNARKEQTKKFLFQEMSNVYEELGVINAKNLEIEQLLGSYKQAGITPSMRAEILDKIDRVKLDKTAASERLSKRVSDLLDETFEKRMDAGIYDFDMSEGEIGRLIADDLVAARAASQKAMGDQYKSVDALLDTFQDPELLPKISEIAQKILLQGRHRIVNAKVDNELFAGITKEQLLQIEPTLKDAPVEFFDVLNERLLRQAQFAIKATQKEVDARASIGKQFPTAGALKKNIPDEFIPEELKAMSDDTFVKGFSLVNLRNTIGTVKAQLNAFMGISRGQGTELAQDLIGLYDGIFDALANPAEVSAKMFKVNLEKNALKAIKDVGKKISPQDKQLAKKVIEEMRLANKNAQMLLEPLDSDAVRKITYQAQFGAYELNEVFNNLIRRGSGSDTEKFFRALQNFDDLMGDSGGVATRATELRTIVKQKLFNDAYVKSLTAPGEPIDFSKFSNELLKFIDSDLTKAETIFGKNTAALKQTLQQLNKLKPNINPSVLFDEISKFNKINVIDKGSDSFLDKNFIAALNELAAASDEASKFASNALIRKLPDATTDEIVTKMFTPQGAENIQLLKETLTPEQFTVIQTKAMNRLFNRAVDVDALSKSAEIPQIFNHKKFKGILDSYGDETLDAMFGPQTRRALRDYEKAIEVMGAGEVGRGAAAGTLAAAYIALNAYNPATWGTLVGLAAVRKLFSSPSYIKMIASNEKGAILQTIDILNQVLLQGFTRTVAGTYASLQESAEQLLGDAFEKTTLDDKVIRESRLRGQELLKEFDEFRIPQRDVSQLQIEMPEILPVSDLSNLEGQFRTPQIESDILLGDRGII